VHYKNEWEECYGTMVGFVIEKMHAYCPQIMSISDSRCIQTNAAPAGSDGCFG